MVEHEKATTRAGIEQSLYANKYNVDEHQSHLAVKEMTICRDCADKPCTRFCPASVYVWEQNTLTVQYSGCLECGSCRFACPYDNIAWQYPRGGYGVIIKHG